MLNKTCLQIQPVTPRSGMTIMTFDLRFGWTPFSRKGNDNFSLPRRCCELPLGDVILLSQKTYLSIFRIMNTTQVPVSRDCRFPSTVSCVAHQVWKHHEADSSSVVGLCKNSIRFTLISAQLMLQFFVLSCFIPHQLSNPMVHMVPLCERGVRSYYWDPCPMWSYMLSSLGMVTLYFIGLQGFVCFVLTFKSELVLWLISPKNIHANSLYPKFSFICCGQVHGSCIRGENNSDTWSYSLRDNF